MATISVVTSNALADTDAEQVGRLNSQRYFWETLTETNADGQPLQLGADVSDVTFAITGTGTAVQIQGSNDGGATWIALKDETGTAISVAPTTASAIVGLATLPEQVRPFIPSGTSVDVDVYAVVRFF